MALQAVQINASDFLFLNIEDVNIVGIFFIWINFIYPKTFVTGLDLLCFLNVSYISDFQICILFSKPLATSKLIPNRSALSEPFSRPCGPAAVGGREAGPR